MKFLYEYRTPDNEKHKGEICAADREAAFAALKAQGIKPSRFAEAPGLLNKLFGKGKRWMAIVVLAVLCVTLAIAVGRVVLNAPQPSTVEESLDSSARRQVIGDAAVIEKGIRTGWADVFKSEGDRFLASFAIPGIPPAVRSTTEGELRKVLDSADAASRRDDDSIEARQIRAMVEGMKEELRAYLADGGTVVGYGTALVARQEQEQQYYNLAKSELEAAAKSDTLSAEEVELLWDKRNGELRKMGIKLVPMPE